MERIGGQMQTLMAGVAQSASHTGHKAGAFGDQLHGLTQAPGLPGCAGAADACGRGDGRHRRDEGLGRGPLHRKVQTSQDEIHRLREELARASVER